MGLPEQASVSIHNLRNNASCFQKEPGIGNLILVRNRSEIDRQQDRVHEDPSNHQIDHGAERDSVRDDRVQEANRFVNEIDNKQELRTVIRLKDEELENTFNQILQDLEHNTILKMEPRKKLPKLKLISDIDESANRIRNEYLHGDENILKITGKVYAIRKAIGIKSGTVHKETDSCSKNKPSNGNRRERRLKAEMKKLRQQIA